MHLITIIAKYFNCKRNKRLGSCEYYVVSFIPNFFAVFFPTPDSASILLINQIIVFRELIKRLFLTIKKNRYFE